MEPKNNNHKKPKLDERFICTIDGKDFVKYPGLLDLAHQKGISRLEVTILQLPTAENGNCAICKAEVKSTKDEVFSDIGDASPNNCSSKVAKHFLRLASTRAIARALRSFTNIGMTCFEELGDINDVIGDKDSGKRKPKLIKSSQKVTKPRLQPEKKSDSSNTEQVESSNGNGNGNGKGKGNGNDSGSGNGKAAKKAVAEPQTQQNPAKCKMSEAQYRALFSLAKRRGITDDEVEAMAQETFNTAVNNLSSVDAASFIRQLQQSA